ncbi:MAG: Trp biosynthesis-associated membrane protein [Microbacterium sp.]
MSETGFAARRGRTLAVVLALAGAGIVLLGSTQTWLVARMEATSLDVAGADALPIVRPLALAVLALALVLTMVGRVLRYVLGALATASGAGMAAMILPVLVSPGPGAVASTVTEHSGLAGEAAVAELVSGIDATGWPAVSFAAACVVVLAGVMTLVTAHRWRRGGRRFEQAPQRPDSGPVDPVDSWDELSQGSDPTR